MINKEQIESYNNQVESKVIDTIDEKFLEEIPILSKWKDKDDWLKELIAKLSKPKLSPNSNVYPLI